MNITIFIQFKEKRTLSALREIKVGSYLVAWKTTVYGELVHRLEYWLVTPERRVRLSYSPPRKLILNYAAKGLAFV